MHDVPSDASVRHPGDRPDNGTRRRPDRARYHHDPHFDVTGRWRIRDNGAPVDPVGDLYDGTRMTGPVGLRSALLKHQDLFVLSLTERLWTYSLSRRVEYYDMPGIRRIIREAANSDNRFSAFVMGIVTSQAFQMSKAEVIDTTVER